MTEDFPCVTAAGLGRRLLESGELALLDVREEGVFAEGHILTASNAPTSRFERIVPLLVPRRGTPVVLVDDDEGLAERAARILAANGYSDVSVLAGGVASWVAAGRQLFSGVFVPSKAFGEFVELAYETPHIDAAELQRRRAAGKDIVLLDSRPFDEYHWITIPGAIDCPGAELVWRVRAVVPSEETLVVVNCGGRTRSIIGAQTLIDAGLPNRVVSLKDGTQGWHLAGLDVLRGASDIAPEPAEPARAWARQAAAALGERLGITFIDAATLKRFERERDTRTLYRFDVRTVEEYRRNHRPDFRSVPGGQLVQATDTFIAVRHARIVLGDDDGVRAQTTAAWLVRMGFPNVFVLQGIPAAGQEQAHDGSAMLRGDDGSVDRLTPADLAGLLEQGAAVVVDFATSRSYRAGHIPGAWFAVRGRLDADAVRLPTAPLYVATSPDDGLAALAARELAAATRQRVKVLEGGIDAWRMAGLPIEADEERLASRDDDVFLKAFERRSHREAAMREYLQWEVDLVDAVKRDGTLHFRL